SRHCALEDVLKGLDPSFSSGQERGLDTIADVKLAKDFLYMGFDGVLAEVNPVRDFAVREPTGDESDDLQLGVTERDRCRLGGGFICASETVENRGRHGRGDGTSTSVQGADALFESEALDVF